MKNLIAAASLLMLVVLSGCGTSEPSDNDARQAIENRISEGKFTFKLLSFRKTNGKMDNAGGKPSYSMDYTAEIEFTEDFQFTSQTKVPFSDWGPALRFASNAKRGERQSISGTMVFEKTEKGWKPIEK